MRLAFRSIHIESFLSLGQVEMSLQDSGYTLVRGHNNNPFDSASSNGSGKSSIFEAIVWCLTGTTMRGSRDVSNIRTGTGALVELEIDIDGNTYKICRSKDHEKYHTNLRIFCNGEDISGKGIRDSEKVLEEHLPELTAELLGSVIVLGQGLPCKFTRNSPSGRKDVLEKLSKSDFMIDDLKVRVSTRKSTLNLELRGLQDSQLACKTQIESVTREREFSKNELHKLEELSNSIEELDSLQAQYDTACSEEALYKEKHDTQADVVHDLLTALNTLRSEKDKESSNIHLEMKDALAELRIAHAERTATKKALEKRIRELEAIQDVCPTCGQRLEGVVKPSTDQEQEQLAKLTEELWDISANLSQKEAFYNEQLSECLFKFQDKDTELNQKYRVAADLANRYLAEYDKASKRKYDLLHAIHELELQQTASNTQSQELKNRINKAEQTLLELTQELESIGAKLTVIEERLSVVSRFETLLKRDFRGALLNNVISYIQDVSLIYASDIFDNSSIEFKLEGNNIVIRYDDRDYENLSGGERQKVDLIIQFAIRDMLCKFLNFDSSILVLDEIFDNLDVVGSKKVNDMLARRLSGIDSIYIISHHADELNIPVDKVLTVVKDSSGVSSVK